ncbi:hypothetical protein PG989_012078 [Apiospora arundinis]
MGELVGFHERGVTFRDGSAVDADAVVWCTGFADKNYRDIAAEILGGGNGAVAQETNRTSGDPSGGNNDDEDDVLEPDEIARRIDTTWGLDAEGEIRGLAKRHIRAENYWAFGGVRTSRGGIQGFWRYRSRPTWKECFQLPISGLPGIDNIWRL